MKILNILFLLSIPALAQNWGLENIHAKQARSLMSTNCKDSTALIGIIDTGIDIKHKDLKTSIWQNPNPIKMNFLGDTDITGWDYTRDTTMNKDLHGHGTHITGIISGKNGVCPEIKVLGASYYRETDNSLANIKHANEALEYLINKGVKVINYSGGGGEFNQTEYDLIEKAREKGILFVMAAGNNKQNSDKFMYFPSAYHFDNIISVAAINQADGFSAFSNWGIESVDIAAPGNSILSTMPSNMYDGYAYMSGTSQATAFVTGVAALLWTENPKLTYQQVRDYIFKGSRKLSSLKNKVKYESTVDALESMRMLKNEDSKKTR